MGRCQDFMQLMAEMQVNVWLHVPYLQSQQRGNNAQYIDPAAILQRIYHVILPHTPQAALQIPPQPPGQPSVTKRPESAYKARHYAK